MVWVAGQAKNHLSKSGSRGIKWVLALLPSPHSHTHSNGAQKMIHGVCLACSLLCSPSSTNTTRAPHLLPWRAPKRKGRYPLRRNPYRALPIASQLELKPLPYPLDGLEPHMSRETVECHWGQHHRAHVESLNRMIAGTELDGMGLEDIILASYNKGDFLPPFDHAAQVWNHEFFWQSMKPCGGGYPSGALLDLIERDFGSSDGMLKEFKRAALTQFGSDKANKLDVGNAVNPCPSETDNKLVITKTPNAVNPLVWDYSLLLAIDVWEHAYYLDYENRRADYISNFMEKLVAWDVVSSRLEVGMARAAERMRERRREQDEEEMADSEAVEMYLDSNNDDSEAD